MRIDAKISAVTAALLLATACGGTTAEVDAYDTRRFRQPMTAHDAATGATRGDAGRDAASVDGTGGVPKRAPAQPDAAVRFEILRGAGTVDFANGVHCNTILGGGPDELSALQGSSSPGIATAFGGTGFHVDCSAVLPGTDDPVAVALDFPGPNALTLDASGVSYQLSNELEVRVTETSGNRRTCLGSAAPGNYALASSTPADGFPRRWPTEDPGAATPPVGGTLGRGGFASTSPTFSSCGGWETSLDEVFGPVAAIELTYRLTY